jgi:Integrase core domain
VKPTRPLHAVDVTGRAGRGQRTRMSKTSVTTSEAAMRARELAAEAVRLADELRAPPVEPVQDWMWQEEHRGACELIAALAGWDAPRLRRTCLVLEADSPACDLLHDAAAYAERRSCELVGEPILSGRGSWPGGTMADRFCRSCGAQRVDGEHICVNCGELFDVGDVTRGTGGSEGQSPPIRALASIEEFASLLEAQVLVEAWRVEYNTYRPHSSLGGLTPAEFAAGEREPARGRSSRCDHDHGDLSCVRERRLSRSVRIGRTRRSRVLHLQAPLASRNHRR